MLVKEAWCIIDTKKWDACWSARWVIISTAAQTIFSYSFTSYDEPFIFDLIFFYKRTLNSLLCHKVWKQSADTTQESNNTLTRQNGHHIADNIFKYIFLNENYSILIQISPGFGPIDNNSMSHSMMFMCQAVPSAAYMRQWMGSMGSALVQIMACHLFGPKPLPKPMLGYCQLVS